MTRHTPATFHAFTIKHTGVVRRVVTELAIFPAFDIAQAEHQEGYVTSALWDTGASISLITPQVVARLSLSPVGLIHIGHVAGSGKHSTYMVNLGLPNKVLVGGVMVAEGSLSDGIEAIIGMDVISQGDFSITNFGGETWMTYRYPSVTPIDYVLEADRLTFAGVNRNAPCPCGKQDANGKPVKFKHCHGAVNR